MTDTRSSLGSAEVYDLLMRLRDYLEINLRPGNDLAPKFIAEISAALRSFDVAQRQSDPAVIERAARIAAKHKGHRNCDEEIMTTDAGKQPVWKFYVEEAREILALSASPPSPDQTSQASPQKVLKAYRSNLREAWSAMTMIREAVETLGPIGAMPASEHLAGPTFMYEAEAIVQGIRSLESSPPSPVAGEITDAMVEAGAKAAAEAAGFCWKHCAQSQWIRDMQAGLKAALSIPSTTYCTPDGPAYCTANGGPLQRCPTCPVPPAERGTP